MRKKQFLFPLLITSALLLLLGSAAGFLLRRLTSLDEEVFEMKLQLRREDSKLRNAKDIKIAFENSLKERELLESVFIQEKELVVFIKDLEQAASQSGVLFKLEAVSLSLSPASNAPPSFTLNTTGAFENLFQFLLLLENLPYQIAFEEVRFQKTPTSWNLSLRFRLLSYAP